MSAGVWAEDAPPKAPPKAEAKKGVRSVALPLVETLNKELGEENALTAEQKEKIEKAREALKAAEDKVREAMGGFDPRKDFFKAAEGILTDAQKAKLHLGGKSAPPHKAPAKKEPPKDEPKE
jgi:predicted phage gp36 major capsid-like protein